MARHSYKMRTVNGYTYYYKRVYTQDGYKDVYGKTVAEVDRKAKTYRQEVEARLNQSDAPFGRFLRDYLDNVHFEGKSPVTIDTYNQLYKYVARSKLAKKRMKNLLPEDIDGFYQDLIKSGKSADVCKNINKIVRPCLRYAFKTRRIALDLGNMITLPKAKRRKRPEQRPFTAEEQRIFEKAAEGSKYYELFITDLYTGLRRGEILALTWRDINFAAASINVDKAVKYIRDPQTGHKHFVTGDTKTETSVREIYVPQALIRLLETYQEKQAAYFAGMGISVDDDFLVFCSSVGSYLDGSNVNKEFKRILKEAGLRDRRFHDLRHTCATRLFELGANPKEVQTYLGHASLAITMDTYTHVLNGQKKNIANRFDKMLESERI